MLREVYPERTAEILLPRLRDQNDRRRAQHDKEITRLGCARQSTTNPPWVSRKMVSPPHLPTRILSIFCRWLSFQYRVISRRGAGRPWSPRAPEVWLAARAHGESRASVGRGAARRPNRGGSRADRPLGFRAHSPAPRRVRCSSPVP